VAAEALVLLPHDGTEAGVLPDHVDDGRAQAHGRLELLAVHQEAAVAAHGHHPAVRVHELGGDRRRQREAHPREAVGDQHRVRLMRGEHARDPQLVQPDVGHEDVRRPERAPDLPQGARRLDGERVVVARGLEAAEHDVVQP
jgi:hypothetical protein